MHGFKKCTKCGQQKPLTEFFARKGAKDGRMSSCKPCKTAATYKWRENNREKLNAYGREYARTEKCVERTKAYSQKPEVRLRNLERERRPEIKAMRKQWRTVNKDKLRHYYKDKNHRRRVAYQDGGVSQREWLGICAKYQHRCVYCYRKTKLTMDHEIPLSAGGKHTPSNIVPACQRCNASKQAKHPIDYAQRFLGRLL